MGIEDRFITFAGNIDTKGKVEKDIKVKGYVRKGKFIQAFQRKQLTNQEEQNRKEVAKKIAIGTATAGAALLGVSLLTYSSVKLKYNMNLAKLGKDLKYGKNTVKMRNDIRDYKPPVKLDDKKESLTFIFPGLPPNAQDQVEGSALMGGVVRKALSGANKKEFAKMEFINTGYTEMISKPVPGDMAKTVVSEISEFAKNATVRGENKDAVAIAQEIFDWHKLNPTKNINFITQSAGGMIARDTSHILVNAGVPASKIKMLGIASPNYGIVDDIVETKYVMHPDDIFANISLDRGNTRWIRSPKPQMKEFAGEDEIRRIEESPVNEMFAIHSAGAYWGKPGINKTAKSTVETAANLFFSKK
jgi:hypothetical protein